MLLTSRVTQLQIYKVKVQEIDSDYELETNLTKVNKSELKPSIQQSLREIPTSVKSETK